jgi:hypothetical protein
MKRTPYDSSYTRLRNSVVSKIFGNFVPKFREQMANDNITRNQKPNTKQQTYEHANPNLSSASTKTPARKVLAKFCVCSDSHSGGARLLRTFANSVRRQADSQPEFDTKSDRNPGTNTIG